MLIICKEFKIQCKSFQGNQLEVVRLVLRKDGLTGKGTFGLVQRVRVLRVKDEREPGSASLSGKNRYFYPQTDLIEKYLQ